MLLPKFKIRVLITLVIFLVKHWVVDEERFFIDVASKVGSYVKVILFIYTYHRTTEQASFNVHRHNTVKTVRECSVTGV